MFVADLKAEIISAANSGEEMYEFVRLPISDILNCIKFSKECSKVLVSTKEAFADPEQYDTVIICSDGSLQLGNGVRASAYAISFGPQAPILNYSAWTAPRPKHLNYKE